MSPSAEPMIGKDTFSLGEMVGPHSFSNFHNRAQLSQGAAGLQRKRRCWPTHHDVGVIARQSRV